MGPAIALGVALVGLVVWGLFALVIVQRRRLAHLGEEHAALAEAVGRLEREREAVRETVREEVMVITGLPEPGSPALSPALGQAPAEGRVIVSATMGQTLVQALALGYGVRRALSPRSLNSIRFEMRREVRRVRKQRRKQMRAAWRDAQARQRAEESGSSDEPADSQERGAA